MNIANVTLGRAESKGEAIALLYIDDPMPESAKTALVDTGMFQQVKPLAFDVG